MSNTSNTGGHGSKINDDGLSNEQLPLQTTTSDQDHSKYVRKSKRLLEKVKSTCKICKKSVKNDDNSVCCDLCDVWFHACCVETDIEVLKNLEQWMCPDCTKFTEERRKLSTSNLQVNSNNDIQSQASKNGTHRTHTTTLSTIQRKNLEIELTKELEEAELARADVVAKAKAEIERADEVLRIKAQYAQRRLEIQSERSFSGSSASNYESLGINNGKVKRWLKNVQIPSDTNEVLQTQYNTNKLENYPPLQIQQRVIQNNALSRNLNLDPSVRLQEAMDNQCAKRPNMQLPEQTEVNPSTMRFESTYVYKYPDDGKVELSSSQVIARQALEKIDLPTFDGDPAEWPLFITSYNLSTARCGYTDVENMIRLKKALRGNALKAVMGRLYFPSQVTSVIERLNELYGRPTKILAGIKEKVRNLPPIRENEMEGLIQMSLEVDHLCGTIEAMLKLEHLHNPDLQQQLIEKLPGHLRLQWAQYCYDVQTVNLNTLREWLIKISKYASRVVEDELPKNKQRCRPAQTSVMNRKFTEKYTVSTHDENQVNSIKSTSEREANPANMCKICETESHSVDICEKFKKMSVPDRWKIVMKKHICGKCLGYHKFYKCPQKEKMCHIDGCQQNHHKFLHKMKPFSSNIQSSGSLQHHNMTQKVYFRIIPVTLYNGERTVSTYAFFDEGSSVTLMDVQLANDLKLEGPSRGICLTWTKNVSRVEENSKCVSVQISGTGTEKFRMNDVQTISDLALPSQTISIPVSENENSHLLGIPIPNYENCRPMILIGQNNYQLGIPLEIRSGKWSEPVAARTRLGWSLYGKSNPNESNPTVNFHECGCDDMKELNELVKSFSSIDAFGARAENVPESEENKRATSILQTVQFDGVRYTAGLLWRKDGMILPESRRMAQRRLECFERKLLKNDNLRSQINLKLDEYMKKGYARKLLPNELTTANNSWYLPMFCVSNPNKPDKIRLVWDAAAVSNGMCLNDALMKGPDQLPMLTYVLYKFREERIGVSADVTEMFHQIRVKRADQEAQRFLWRNCNTNDKPQEYIMQVQTFGASCSPSVSQYVKNLNSDRFVDQFPLASRAVKENFYVDDYLDSFSTIEEAIQISDQVQFINRSGGFQLKDWQSNSKIVLNALHGESPNVTKEIREKESQISKVLGMQWDTSSDTFVFRINYTRIPVDVLNDTRPPTKRELLRVLMCVFDPLGLISSYLLLGKLLLRDVWNSNVEWDDYIKPAEREKWTEWIKLMVQIEGIQIPRCYALNESITSRQIHVFVDASEQAFSAVSYIRSESEYGVEVRQIGSKTRIAPNKPLSIPRLELLAAVMGTRLLNTIIEGHKIKFDKRFMWSDSKTVLCWINSDARSYKQFVGLRIGEITDSTERSEWKWVSTKDNVADEATKRPFNPKFASDSRWYNGPHFLYESQINWSKEKDFKTVLPVEEFRVQIHAVGDDEMRIPKTPDFERFSSWKKLLRTQATVIRFAKNLKATSSSKLRDTSPLQNEELNIAKTMLIKKMQWECFQTEVTQFNDNRDTRVDKSSGLYKYTPFMDDHGVLRMRGRINNIEGVPYDTKYPVIMGRNHKVTTLIIEAMHRQFLHRNHEIVINELRNLYVIPHLRRELQKIRTTCQFCKNRVVKPIPPLMGQLPKSRLSPFLRPFSFVGVDCFGPMEIVNGRKVEKRWGVIYTCLTIRAIHIEIASSLSADSFIMSLKRFMVRRGAPLEITCDNGTNFRGGSQELVREMKNIDTVRLQTEFTNIKWKFNPPGAPHFGGAWERMIQSVKSNLMEIMSNRRRPTDELLHTVLIECEGIVNTRPLTHIPLDDADDAPLTPNSFLLGSSNGSKPLADLRDVDERKVLKKMWVTAEQISKQFWRKWMRDYLPTLTRRTKWFEATKPLCVGDIVIIAEEKQPTKYWPKGRIIEVYKGKDDQIRSAKIQTRVGTYIRPTVKLAVLDVSGNKPPTSFIGVENVIESERNPIDSQSYQP